MRRLRHCALFIVLISVFFSCRKEKSSENNGNIPVVNQQWEFQEAGVLFSGPMDSTFISSIGVAVSLNIPGTTKDGNGNITLQIIAGSIIPGVYNSPQVLFRYSEGGVVLLENSANGADDFNITITSIDSISVSGTFAGTVVDGLGNKQTVSEGKFTAAIGQPVLPPVVPDYFPLGNVWTYGNTDDPANDTLKIASVGTTVLNGQTYTQLLNDKTGETSYYRKQDGIYYQYLLSAFGQTLETPVELVILQENFPINTYWQSDDYVVNLGVPITVQLRSRITQSNFSLPINGRTYDNLIEVTSELYTKDSNGDYVFADTSFITIFAKGIGIVFYQDLNTGIDWGIRNYNVTP